MDNAKGELGDMPASILFSQLSWMKTIFEDLFKGLKSDRPPHAVLVTGTKGIGKELLIHALIARLFCSQSHRKEGCGECKSCHWLKSHTHPDFLFVQPEQPEKPIKIDQVRVLNQFFELTAQNVQKIALISDAHLMNINAANGLLKTLEEPAGNGLIFLVSDDPEKLPITIRSRVQRIHIHAPKRDEALIFLSAFNVVHDDDAEILHLTYNAPLLALKWHKNGTLKLRKQLMGAFIEALGDFEKRSQCAEVLAKEAYLSIDLLCAWLNDAIRIKIDLQSHIANISYRDQIIRLHSLHSLWQLSEQYEALLLIKRRLSTQTKIDWQLDEWLMGFY